MVCQENPFSFFVSDFIQEVIDLCFFFTVFYLEEIQYIWHSGSVMQSHPPAGANTGLVWLICKTSDLSQVATHETVAGS